MSEPHASADPHPPAAHGHSADHHPHVLPFGTYLAIFLTLLVLTGITVGASYVNLGSANIIIALGIATMKALCVALIFMHLLFDKKFNAIVFASALIFLAIFIGFTMSDTNFRGLDGRVSADGPADVTNPFGGTRSQAAMERIYHPVTVEDIRTEPVGPKMDVGLNPDTAAPSGTAMTVDVPSIADAPGAVAPAGEKAE